MSVVELLVRWFAPWQSLYADSTLVSTTVTALHIVALLVGGGLAIASDRMTLRALKRPDDAAWRNHLSELHDVHKWVLLMLVLLFASGVLQAAADIEAFAGSRVFWVKLGLVTLLLVNGMVLSRPGIARHKLGIASRVSITLWILTTIAGTVLMSV